MVFGYKRESEVVEMFKMKGQASIAKARKMSTKKTCPKPRQWAQFKQELKL